MFNKKLKRQLEISNEVIIELWKKINRKDEKIEDLNRTIEEKEKEIKGKEKEIIGFKTKNPAKKSVGWNLADLTWIESSTNISGLDKDYFTKEYITIEATTTKKLRVVKNDNIYIKYFKADKIDKEIKQINGKYYLFIN